MRFHALAVLAASLHLAVSTPVPQDDPPIDANTCLQNKFLSALSCSDIDAAYNNETLPSFGWYCCWYQGPFTAPPALPVSAWVLVGENNTVADRCLTSGSCTPGLPRA
ncbi:hypothetical protein F5X99DRAFT_383263 [Biscogniauxia marginata]|nr:hypothetical protein F5X99DRAFT_383263 [Biscogniauxia marginata]